MLSAYFRHCCRVDSYFCFYGYGDHRDLHVLTHSFPTRRSADLAVYYQARLPWQAGLIPIGEYLTDINLTAARYYTSEVIDAPDKDVAPNFWDDLRYNVLSYDRGAMYFAMLKDRKSTRLNSSH